MVNLVESKSGKLVTTSKVIADAFGKVHRNVMRDIENLNCSEEFRALNFEQSFYVTPQNKKLKCFELTRDGFSFLCMGFNGDKAAKWKEAYINAFNQMEKGLLNIDSRMTELSKKGDEIKVMGSEWSKFGRQINKAKKNHLAAVGELVDEVQLKLDINGDKK